jgi:hypothetical protein
MAILRLSTTARNALANAIKTAIDAGAGAGTIKIYSGAQPATPQDAPATANVLLGTLTFSKPSFPTGTVGVITASAITQDSSADASGTAAWARLADSDGNAIMDVDVGTTGCTINLNTTTVVSGGPIAITSATITVPQ